MFKNPPVIDINPTRRPYNTYMVLSLNLLRKITPLLENEIMKGLIDSDGNDRVVLHLHLEADKIKRLKRVISRYRVPLAIK
ncbi:MAG: hypothetical protein ACJ75B_13890 [Flavisolibacter sp.]